MKHLLGAASKCCYWFVNVIQSSTLEQCSKGSFFLFVFFPLFFVSKLLSLSPNSKLDGLPWHVPDIKHILTVYAFNLSVPFIKISTLATKLTQHLYWFTSVYTQQSSWLTSHFWLHFSSSWNGNIFKIWSYYLEATKCLNLSAFEKFNSTF